MENKRKIRFGAINDLIEFIDMFDRQMKRELAQGNSETSLSVRQAKYLRDRYIKELNDILKEFDLTLQTIDKAS
ncbi:MAG: hypothetical protein NW226_24375 [Microscillaceae bacterium]|nr:hypothetical protein [Microscillaceae bacterium]